MKKYYLFIALVMVAAMTVSCKNNNKKAAKTAEANAEVVEAAKTILADDVLATIDELVQAYINADGGEIAYEEIIASSLTEEEKLIKPDYLLEASRANEMVTKSQKLNTLAILLVERPIRIAYGMPTEGTDEVIAHFIADVNSPVNLDGNKDLTLSEKLKKAYEFYKERGDVADFWQSYGLASVTELGYLISKNTDAFFRNINEDQYAAFLKRVTAVANAVRFLSEYDPEVKQAWDAFNAGGEVATDIDLSQETIEHAKIFFSEREEIFAARRANLLK